MTSRATPEDGPPMAPVRVLRFAGGVVELTGVRESHPGGVTPTTITNAKHTRPAEQYPGEAERMIDTWTTLAIAAVQRARDATTPKHLVSELEGAARAVSEALRWSKP
jgi:hypothetical protein